MKQNKKEIAERKSTEKILHIKRYVIDKQNVYMDIVSLNVYIPEW